MPGDVRAEARRQDTPPHTLKGTLKPTLKGTLSALRVHARTRRAYPRRTRHTRPADATHAAHTRRPHPPCGSRTAAARLRRAAVTRSPPVRRAPYEPGTGMCCSNVYTISDQKSCTRAPDHAFCGWVPAFITRTGTIIVRSSGKRATTSKAARYDVHTATCHCCQSEAEVLAGSPNRT